MSFSFADLEVPVPIRDATRALLTAKSAFFSSGAAVIEPDDGTGLGGNFYKRRYAAEDAAVGTVITGSALSPAIIGAHADVGPVIRRARFRRIVDGAGAAEGGLLASNPAQRVVDSTAAYWSLEYDTALLSVLAAAFDATGPLYSTHLLPYAASGSPIVTLSFAKAIEAAALLGDRANDIVALVCHSKVAKDLVLEMGARPLAAPISGAPLYPTGLYVGNARLLVSDLCPVAGSGTFAAYTSFLLTPGSLWMTEQQGLREIVQPNASIPSLDVTQSSHVALGVSGLSCGTTVNPSNAELADPTEWSLTISPATPASIKSVGLVAVTSNAS